MNAEWSAIDVNLIFSKLAFVARQIRFCVFTDHFLRCILVFVTKYLQPYLQAIYNQLGFLPYNKMPNCK
jgi:hypothetical protein